MKAVIVLAGLVALALAVPQPHHEVETKPVDADFVARQKKVLTFFQHVGQVNSAAEYYKIGQEYDIEANIENYTNKTAVHKFLKLYKTGFMPKFEVFSIFYERMREEAVSLFYMFYYAKDFDTFYKTAAFAKVHFNEYQFVYALYTAVVHRDDTTGFALPAPYEIYPEMFTNMDVFYKAAMTKMQNGVFDKDLAASYGIVQEKDFWVFYTNYSNYWTYDNAEQKLSYFTEDVGLNSYYYYFHTNFPFWFEGDNYGIFKERRGEIYYYFYQQLLARYYLERLSNGLGEIPDFSWFHPITTGYTPYMSIFFYPYAQRKEHYQIPMEKYYKELQFLDTYEKTFLQYLQRGHFKAYNQEIDFQNSKAVNFVGNYWQANPDLYEKTGPRNYHQSYEITGRLLLGAAPQPLDKHTVFPAALSFYQTSLRDPVFYQFYSKIIKYFLQYKEYLEPYTQENLHYVGVKVNDVKVDRMVTYFDFFEYDISNEVLESQEELKTKFSGFKIRQPRLDHKPFSINIDVKSDSECEAVFKVFLGPKYDSNGLPINLEDNWMNFVELDWFVHKLSSGQNKIERKSEEFFFYKEDSLPTYEVLKYLDQGKVPVDQSTNYDDMPKRLMLPKGTTDGSPFQLFVFVYPYQALSKEFEEFKEYIVDNKPFGYPFDRPVDEAYFKQPNMFFEDVYIHHEGEEFPYTMNNPFYVPHKNAVPKQ